jgi:hypothetical protein
MRRGPADGGRLCLLRKRLPSYAGVVRSGRLMPIARSLGGQPSRHFADIAARIADIASQLRRNAEQLQHAFAHTSSALAFCLRMANDCRAGSTQRTALHPATRGATAATQKAGSQAPWEPVFFLPHACPGMPARAAVRLGGRDAGSGSAFASDGGEPQLQTARLDRMPRSASMARPGHLGPLGQVFLRGLASRRPSRRSPVTG